MASSGTQTVFGFGAGLNWRPTFFSNPFPSTSVCSACGFVPSTIATLPCRHFLCQLCYDRSAGKHGHCPLDAEPIEDESVVWSTMSKDSILGRKVRCWNAENGCDVEDTASAVLDHFNSGCEFHTAACPRCGEKMPHRDIPNHLESTCGPPCRCEQPFGDNLVNVVLEVKEEIGKISLKLDSFGERVGEGSSLATLPTTVADAVTAIVEKTSSACRTETEAAFAEHLGEISQVKAALSGNEQAIKKAISEECDRQIQAFKNKVAEELTKGSKAVEAALAFLEREAKEKSLKEKDETRPMEVLAAVSLCIHSDVLTLSLPYRWIIDDWEGFCEKKDASREYIISLQGEARHHLGYLVIPELCYSKPGSHIWFRVHVVKGLFDKFLKWPMNKKLEVRFFNPKGLSIYSSYVSGLEWISPPDTLPGVTKQVVCTGYSEALSVSTLDEKLILNSNSLGMDLKLTI
uniref:TRAF-type domain-containing protein n=1 Tax=Amblyomma triste TaxID=251400 RepID=A0A023G7R9_AMBTT